MRIQIETQPDDTTCGPTCLHAVYKLLGLDIALDKVIGEINYLENGGTLGVYLGLDALKRGYEATIYNYNLRLFDPSWNGMGGDELAEKLSTQLKYKKGKKFTQATNAYINFLENKGKIEFPTLDADLIRNHILRGEPIIAGLSATFLYQSKREYTLNNQTIYDEFRGFPAGHFVVIFDIKGNNVIVADPFIENPISKNNYYEVDIQRLINSILLGIITYDSNLLIIKKKM